MSKLNYGFINADVKFQIEKANIYMFAISDIRNQLVAEKRGYTRKVTTLESDRESALASGNLDNAAKIGNMIADYGAKIAVVDEKISDISAKRTEILIGVHTKSVNIDGVLDNLKMSSLYEDYCDYREGVTSRQTYIDAIADALKAWGMSAPDKLFVSAARKIADSIGFVKTSDKQVVKGQLIKCSPKMAYFELLVRVLTTEMRSKIGFTDYTSDSHKSHVAWGIVNNKVSALNVWVEHK